MNKLISLIKATIREDFNKNNFKREKREKKIHDTLMGLVKTFLIVFIATSVIGTICAYAYLLGQALVKLNLTYIMLSVFSMITIIIVFMEGVYRSGSVLFDSKDNDMLLSMPIKKSTIVGSRLIRFILFEYIWTLLIMIPAVIMYAYFEKTNIYFYISTIIFLITLPIIPTIAASIIGYFIKLISSRFKKKNIVQTIFSLLFTVSIFLISIYLQIYIKNIMKEISNINDLILKIYYPLGVYIQMLFKFSLFKIFMLLLGNVLLVILFIYLFSFRYFKIISKLSENYAKSNYKLNKEDGKTRSATYALFRKELSKYLSSSIYLINTSLSTIMIIGVGLYFGIKAPTTLIINGQDLTVMLKYLPKALMMFFAAAYIMSSTTALSISIEGKSFWITKSLPVKETKIFISKILIYLFMILPVSYITIIIMSIRFKFEIFDIILLFVFTTIMAIFVSMYGLIINLTWPKLNFKSEAQVVKQSLSVVITMLVGILIIGIIAITLVIFKPINLNLFATVTTGIIGIITAIMWIVLKTYGVRKFKELNN